MKIVRENMDDILKPKTKEESEVAMMSRLEEILEMDPSDQIDAIAQWLDVDQYEAASFIIGNIDAEARNKGIKDVFMYQAEDFLEQMDEE